MAILIDIKGKRFGKLVALRHIGGGLWECLCVCGKRSTPGSHHLRKGNAKSCGCGRHESQNRAEKNANWYGDKVSKRGVHSWVKRRLKKPTKCQDCGETPIHKTGLDLANISQEYKRDITDWEWLCRKCHMTKDGRISKMKELSIKGNKARSKKVTPKRRKEISKIANRARYGK